MSRHRSPGGRHAHPRQQLPPAADPGAPPSPPARPRAAHAATRSGLRNGLGAAAVTGATLALTAPVLADLDTTAPADTAVLALSATGVAAPPVSSQVRMVASVTPVGTAEPAPPAVATAELLKAFGIAEQARQVEEARIAREARAACDTPLGGLGAVKPWVRDGARFLSCLYDSPTLIGVASRGRVSDHPSGHAVDMMVRGEHGDRIAECALANQDALGVDYVIWEQRVNYGEGWEPMADRGGDTANHMDHVHLSFERGGAGGSPAVEPCA